MSVTDPLDRQTSYLYTNRGQLRQITGPDPGPGVGEDPAVWNFTYDLAGNQLTAVDPLNRTTTTVYDAQNRVKEVQMPTIASGTPKTIYGYDLAGQLTSVSDSVNTTGYEYDFAGRVKQVNHPAGGSTFYTYNAAHEVTRVIDRNERKTDFTYNDLGLPLTEKWRESNETLVRTLSWTYDDAGRVLQARDADAADVTLSKYTYQYDLGDMVTSVDNLGTPGVPNVVLNYAYDYAGNRTSLTDNLNHSISYTYADHRLDTMSLLSGIDTVATVDFGYDSIGRLSAINRLAGTWEPIKTAFSYDNADRLKQIKHTRETQTPTTLSQFDYTFDVASQLKTLNVTGQSLWSESLTYGYDNIGQLTSVTGTRNGQAVSGETYSFDINGNRTNFTTTAGNRMSSDGTFNYVYDDEGNTVTKTRISNGEVTTFTWDHRNRMEKAQLRAAGGALLKEQRNTYDVHDRRIGVWEDDNGDGVGTQRWTVYDGDNAWADFNASGAVTKRYLSGPAIDQVFAEVGATGNLTWLLTDHLGSVRQVVNTTGQVLDAVTFDSFGRILMETSAANGSRFKYTAREWDALFNLQYNRARYYSPDTARWLSEDPIGFGGGDTNLYRYVGNSPTNATDPSGLLEWIRDGGHLYVVREFLGFNRLSTQRWVGIDRGDGLIERNGRVATLADVYAAGYQSDWDVWFQANDLNVLWDLDRTNIEARRGNTGDPAAADTSTLRSSWTVHDPTYENQLREIGEVARQLPLYIGETLAGRALAELALRLLQAGYRVVRNGTQRLLLRRVSGRIVAHPVGQTQQVCTLTGAAQRAHARVGPGRGGAHGTRVHTAFEAEVRALGNSNFRTEVSYLKGRVVPRGTPGSVRLDVVEGPLNAPTAIYDLKTGQARLTPARIAQIRQHIPGGVNVPVIEIR